MILKSPKNIQDQQERLQLWENNFIKTSLFLKSDNHKKDLTSAKNCKDYQENKSIRLLGKKLKK